MYLIYNIDQINNLLFNKFIRKLYLMEYNPQNTLQHYMLGISILHIPLRYLHSPYSSQLISRSGKNMSRNMVSPFEYC